MMRSLYSGVAGLKVHQTRMDVIGNNIANVNTVGFKSQTVNFSELFYQTTQSASGPNAETGTGGQNAKQIGLGVSVAAVSTNITSEGGSQSTGNAFDLKINGGSFFVIQKGGANYYSKAGNFTTDGYGNLVTSSGAYVMGYTAARDEASGDMVLQNDELRPISVYGSQYMNTDPAQTTQATMSGNINSEDENFSPERGGYITTTLSAYDSLGNLYSVMFKISYDQNSATHYTMSPMAVYKGNTEMTDITAQLSALDGTETAAIDLYFDGATGYLDTTDTNGDGNSTEGKFILNIQDTAGNNLDSYAQDIVVDLSQLKCMAASSSVEANRGSIDHLGEGKAVGTMIELGIQADGKVVASYDNGDEAVIGQILVASFANPSGLQKEGDNLFAQTLNSGEAVINDITASGETMSSGVLEMSNVDLADEFTSMIVTQRGYQANSRVITTSDTMIEELLSLKR